MFLKKSNLLEMNNKRRLPQTKVMAKNRLTSPNSYRNFPLPYLNNLNKKKNLTAQQSLRI